MVGLTCTAANAANASAAAPATRPASASGGVHSTSFTPIVPDPTAATASQLAAACGHRARAVSPQVGTSNNYGEMTWALPSFATAESFSALQPGDILDYTAEHTFLFAGWIDQAAGTFGYYAESNSNDSTHYSIVVATHHDSRLEVLAALSDESVDNEFETAPDASWSVWESFAPTGTD
jgi:hypothetical protein